MSAADKENTLILTLDTGPVTIQLLPDKAPGHVARIKELARQGFYDGVVFHRVIPGFMAQGGDPTGTGMGGSKLPDLPQEFSAEPHVRGVCSMARSSDPKAPPSILFNYLKDPADRADLRASVKLTREILAQKSMAPFAGEELFPGIDVQSDDAIDAWVRRAILISGNWGAGDWASRRQPSRPKSRTRITRHFTAPSGSPTSCRHAAGRRWRSCPPPS